MTDIEISQALKIVDRTLEPERLNKVQELVLRECWLGKTYQQIAAASGYDSDYVRVVGSRLWQALSEAFDRKVSKNNFKSILKQKSEKRKFAVAALELPDGQVPLNSDFYIERPPCEAIAYEEIVNPGALVVIKSPPNMGKTSLMTRILDYARSQNYRTISINFQLAEAHVLSDLKKFLRWLMANITLQLGIESEINRYWNEDLGIKISCTKYFREYILQQRSEPLVLAFDEIDNLLKHTEIVEEFLPMLRYWYEEASNSQIWQSLRMVIVHPTDIYLPLDIDRSPFNLGLPIILPEFDLDRVRDLALRYQFQQQMPDLEQSLKSLMDMVGGYPYLIRLAFHALSTREITVEQLLKEAPTSSSIYRNFLQRYFIVLEKHPELIDSFERVVTADSPIRISNNAAYKLESIGLVKLQGNNVVPSCKLYRLYFRNYFLLNSQLNNK